MKNQNPPTNSVILSIHLPKTVYEIRCIIYLNSTKSGVQYHYEIRCILNYKIRWIIIYKFLLISNVYDITKTITKLNPKTKTLIQTKTETKKKITKLHKNHKIKIKLSILTAPIAIKINTS